MKNISGGLVQVIEIEPNLYLHIFTKTYLTITNKNMEELFEIKVVK